MLMQISEGADVEVTSERIVIGQREDAPSGELTVTLRRGDG